jgi:di/tricarboxylate transporter
MFDFFSDPNFKILITFLVTIFAFVSFVKEKIPAHVTAMTTMAILLATGVINTGDALTVFSSSAGITIACMFIISAALQKTGVIDLIGYYILLLTEKNKILGIVSLFSGVLVTSAFMNNTPVVIIMTPIVISLAKKLKDYPSKYLIPLSYTAILGGTCTLIGTSTNILVDAIAQDHGKAAFSMFEVGLPGIIVSITGILFMTLIGRKLLPERMLLESEFNDSYNKKKFIAEAIILRESKLIGQILDEIQFSKDEDYEIIDLVRNNTGSRSGNFIKKLLSTISAGEDLNNATSFRTIPLEAGDKLIFKTNKEELMVIKDNFSLSFDAEDLHSTELTSSKEVEIYEGVIGINSQFIDKKASELGLRQKYGSYILAIHRDKKNITSHFDAITLKYGDVLLIEGPKEKIDNLFDSESITNVTHVKHREFDRKKAPIAIATLATVVGFASFNMMPIAGLAIIGAVTVMLTGCINMKKAHKVIEWPILMLIFGMLSLSVAMAKTGSASLIVDYIASSIGHHGPVILLIAIYIMTSILTEIMSNNAAAVLLAPIAIGLADSIGVDSRPFIIAVMFAASASFATPIGYQTNTYIYNIGNYRFSDFLKVGIPMNLTMMCVAVTSILLIWDF